MLGEKIEFWVWVRVTFENSFPISAADWGLYPRSRILPITTTKSEVEKYTKKIGKHTKSAILEVCSKY